MTQTIHTAHRTTPHHTTMGMAHCLHSCVIASCFFLALTFKFTLVSSNNQSQSPHHLKSLHFALYQHETINKTGYIIVNGVPGTSNISQATLPFGTLFAFQDPMTVAVNRSSKLAGIAEGTSVTSSLDGLQSISIAKITLKLKNHKGSISIVGGTHNIKPADHPIVGGTGDFLFAQGYVTSSPVNLTGLTVVYKIQFNIYWPPYAHQATLH